MNNNPIGIFDSGVGGLSLLAHLRKQLPHESFLYFSDQKHCPYGTKTYEEIYAFSKEAIEFLLVKKIKLLVIACNTVTVTSLERLRRDFPALPIIGIIPVVKKAATVSKSKRIGILSTLVTSRSEYQKNLIDTFAFDCIVINKGTDKLVPLIENRVDEKVIRDTVKEELAIFQKNKVDVIALGCSHFPFLKRQMQEILGNQVVLLDSGRAVARQAKRVLEKKGILAQKSKPAYLFYTTGDRKIFSQITRTVLGCTIKKVARIDL